VFVSELEEILKEDAAVAGLVRMLPTGGVFRPILERLLEVELHRVDHLSIAALDHHLIAAQVGGREQLKPFRNSVDLHTVILPDPKNVVLSGVVLPDPGGLVVYPLKDRV
jgi:hypothetical protein